MVNFVFDSLAAHREHVAISLAGRELIYWYLKINENLEIQKNIIALVSMLASLTESNQKIMQIQESYFQKFFAARSATSKKKVVPPQNPDDKWAPSQQEKKIMINFFLRFLINIRMSRIQNRLIVLSSSPRSIHLKRSTGNLSEIIDNFIVKMERNS